MRQKSLLMTGIEFGALVLALLVPVTIGETLYVDGMNGNDGNPGTEERPLGTIGKAAIMVNSKREAGPTRIKLAAAVYNLRKAVVFDNNRPYTEEKRLVIEASILPDDPEWKPVLMPIILSTGELLPDDKNRGTYGLKIEMSHVTIRGLKFLGNPMSANWYWPVWRGGQDLDDLIVTKCLFMGDREVLPIQVAIIAQGHGLVVDHCIFYNCRNSVVFWNAAGGASKRNAMRYCIVDGAYISGLWVCQTAEDFEFHHNIITRGQYAWMRDSSNRRDYRLHDCIITNNEHYSGKCDADWKVSQTGPEITYEEENIIKWGRVILETTKAEVGSAKKRERPGNYLHVVPGTLGSDLGAGLFTKSACEIQSMSADGGCHTGQFEIQFIGNAAFHITDGKSTLLIDFLYRSGAYGYMEYKMENVKPIKDGLSLITHSHADHWNQALFEKMAHAIIAPPDILEKVKSKKKIPLEDVMVYKEITIEAFATRHDGPPRQFQHYSYLVTWHDLRLYIPGDAVLDHFLTMTDIDVMFIGPGTIRRVKDQNLALDAKTLILFHHRSAQKVSPSKDCLVLKQGETLEVEFKEKASFASTEDFESIYAHALRGNIKKVLEILDSIPNENLTKEQVEIKEKYYKRFQEQNEEVATKTEDPFVRYIIESFHNYWRKVFLQESSLEKAEQILWDNLTEYLLANNLVEPNETREVVREAPDVPIKRILKAKGYYGLMGRTWPYHELMIWQKETEKEYLVELPEGHQTVRVVFLDDFIIRGWTEYATLGKSKSGGWAKKGALYCPVHYDLSSEDFKVKFLCHEAQHLADYNLFGELEPCDFEYRAKLAELSKAKDTINNKIKDLLKNSKYDKKHPHPFANYCVIRDLSGILFNQDFVSDMKKWEAIPYEKINEASTELLKKNTRQLKSSGAESVTELLS
ncbi:MAG: MBL fold metallo-hydrolase [Planctomycetota bacterium]|jgi:hypothetical protein